MALYDPFAAFDDLMDFDVVYQPMFGPGPAPGPRGEHYSCLRTSID